MAFKNEHDAGYLSEPIFGRFRGDLGVQNRPKIGPESVSRAIKQQKAKMLKNNDSQCFLKFRGVQN